MDTILKNAVMSIQMGVEDFESKKPERIISSIRNLFSGVLLLYKEKLRRLSPIGSDEVLIKQTIQPKRDSKDRISFMGNGKKTVDVHEIKARFKTLNIQTDWARAERIQCIRNDLEHYCTKSTRAAIEQVLSESFLIIRDFLQNELTENALGLLGKPCWDALLANNEVFAAEEARCVASRDECDFDVGTQMDIARVLACPDCGSGLLFFSSKGTDAEGIDIVCQSCGYESGFIPMAEGYLKAEFYDFEALKDGALPIITVCPVCAKEGFSRDEKICLLCGEEQSYLECLVCGESLDVEDEIYDGLCGYHAQQKDKDD